MHSSRSKVRARPAPWPACSCALAMEVLPGSFSGTKFWTGRAAAARLRPSPSYLARGWAAGRPPQSPGELHMGSLKASERNTTRGVPVWPPGGSEPGPRRAGRGRERPGEGTGVEHKALESPESREAPGGARLPRRRRHSTESGRHREHRTGTAVPRKAHGDGPPGKPLKLFTGWGHFENRKPFFGKAARSSHGSSPMAVDTRLLAHLLAAHRHPPRPRADSWGQAGGA